MATYEVTSTGPKGYQVTAISPEFQGAVIEDFSSLQSAQAFAEDMRKIDAALDHSDRNQPA
ncbi:MAG: hypothetical protein WB902_29290 [Acetobacteraceae bacterium]|jgi:hypothetical protein